MRAYFLSFILVVAGSFAGTLTAQTTTTTFKVSGNCRMCKKNIETAATASGASSASWDAKSKSLTVTYNATTSSTQQIQKSIADAGYDNDGFTATEESYNKLHACCQYDRKATAGVSAEKACCVKDGKCKGNKPCCKNSGKKDCCKSATCEKEGGCCSTCKMKESGGCCAGSGKDHKECKGKCEHRP